MINSPSTASPSTGGGATSVRVALYARVSSQQQANDQTIVSQVAALQARIASDGFGLEEELCFLDDGYSGSTLFRPALERLRDQAAAGSLDRLYVHSPDRLARSCAYQVVLVDELKRHGVELVFLNRDIRQSPEDTLLLQMQGMMAEYERAKIMERSRRGKRHAAQAGALSVLSGAPYGYRYLGKYAGGGQARYEIDEAQAEVVRQIFAWVGLERCSLGEACRRLEQRKILSPRGQTHWDRSTVWGLLTNTTYIGTAQFGKRRVGPLRPRMRARRGCSLPPRQAHSRYVTAVGERITLAVPALVDEVLFAAVAEQLAENRQRHRQQKRGASYLLQGLLVCGRCGYAYYGKALSHRKRQTRQGRPGAYVYYRCIGTEGYRFGGKAVCTNKPCRTDHLETAVWEDVCALLAEPQRVRAEYERRLRGQHTSSGRPAEQLAKMIGNVRRGLARLIDAYQEGHLEKADFDARITGLEERLQKLETEQEASAQAAWERSHLQVMIEHVEMFAQRVQDGLKDADWQTRRDIMRALIKHVEVGEDGVRVVYKVQPRPFEPSPPGGLSQHCWNRGPPSGGQLTNTGGQRHFGHLGSSCAPLLSVNVSRTTPTSGSKDANVGPRPPRIWLAWFERQQKALNEKMFHVSPPRNSCAAFAEVGAES
jgi:site-specific DNA recombinase